MDLLNARNLFGRRKSFLFPTVAILVALIGPSLICYDHARVESAMVAEQKGKEKKKKKKDSNPEIDPASISGKGFQGGVFEASGVVAVPGANGALFVDDNRGNEIFWMGLDQEGNQVGEIKPIRIGVSVDDMEGITFDGAWFYVVASQFVTRVEGSSSLIRFRFDSETQSVADVESVRGLYQFLTGQIPELKEYAGKRAKRGPINIEGLAWDPIRERFLLGLRDPIISEQALVVALRLKDPNAPLSSENLTLAEPSSIRLPLGGSTIRSIEFDDYENMFQIISGEPENNVGRKKTDFKLWEWDGDTYLREKASFNPLLKPEGITRVAIGGRDFLFIVCDVSQYFTLN
jgi:Protein of unknown function (DUF3616)